MGTLSTRPLGHSGIEVSVLGLGANNFGWRIDRRQTEAVLDAALDAGVNFLDTADSYGKTHSEEFIGEVLRGRRERVVLATKFGSDLHDGWNGPRGSGAYIRRAVEASLRRLQTDVIDLYWYHWPDHVTPILETLTALHELVRAGKVRAIGACNFSAAQIQEADHVARAHGLTPFTAVQNEYSLLARDVERTVLPLCARLKLAFIPYFPLTSGLLTGKYRRGVAPPAGTRLADGKHVVSDAQWDQLELLRGYADARRLPLTHVAIGALLAQPVVASVIAGATKPAQVRANAAAATWRPSRADLDALRRLLG